MINAVHVILREKTSAAPAEIIRQTKKIIEADNKGDLSDFVDDYGFWYYLNFWNSYDNYRYITTIVFSTSLNSFDTFDMYVDRLLQTM